MLKINSENINKHQGQFCNYFFDDFLSILQNANTKNYPEFTKLLNFLSFKKGGLNFSKIKKLITGDIEFLNEAKNKVGKLTKKDLEKCPGCDLLSLYRDFAKSDFAYKWMTYINTDTCPYCNRSYTYSVLNKKVRPDFDHYYEQSDYAYLSVSMFNLVPCCKQCNCLKNHDRGKTPILYPYTDEFGTDAIFKIDNFSSKSITDFLCKNSKLKITIEYNKRSSIYKKLVGSTKVFALDKLYDKHSDYVKDIVIVKQKYTPRYIKKIGKHFKISKYHIDCCDLLFLNRLNPDEQSKRILSKLTFDILNQLDGK